MGVPVIRLFRGEGLIKPKPFTKGLEWTFAFMYEKKGTPIDARDTIALIPKRAYIYWDMSYSVHPSEGSTIVGMAKPENVPRAIHAMFALGKTPESVERCNEVADTLGCIQSMGEADGSYRFSFEDGSALLTLRSRGEGLTTCWGWDDPFTKSDTVANILGLPPRYLK